MTKSIFFINWTQKNLFRLLSDCSTESNQRKIMLTHFKLIIYKKFDGIFPVLANFDIVFKLT